MRVVMGYIFPREWLHSSWSGEIVGIVKPAKSCLRSVFENDRVLRTNRPIKEENDPPKNARSQCWR
jgi:hypothetical protein